MGYHYLAEITVYRNDDAEPKASNPVRGDAVPGKEATSRELLRTYIRAQTLGELRGAVEKTFGIVTDIHDTEE